MWIDRLWDWRSLRAKLLTRYLVILGIGGLVTCLIGSWMVSSTIRAQMNRALSHNLGTVRTNYAQTLASVGQVVRLTASAPGAELFAGAADDSLLLSHLERIRVDNGLDFLTLIDRFGRVVERDGGRGRAPSLPIVRAALQGESATGTEVLSASQLDRENPSLSQRARVRVVPTAHASGDADSVVTSGLVLMGAAPIRESNGTIAGALYGGILLNGNFHIVDDVWNVLYEGERYRGRDVGAVTIFEYDVRIATTVRTNGGERAVGTRMSDAVRQGVLGEGEVWNGRAFVVDDWYLSAYQPVRSYEGAVVGAVYVGVLERLYTSTRDRVILSFFVLATTGFILIIVVTDYMVRQITRPIGEMVAATRNLAAGHFDQEVNVQSQGEIALLAQSFNNMQRSLRGMKADLEEWTRTLEDKVQERTEQLIAMQNRVAQSERLASLGMLSAGVAHEINNPLGGILSLTALVLEDLENQDPARENLEEVVRQSERCRDIVKGLLEFSRQQEVGSDVVDVRVVLDETLALLSKQALFHNIKLEKFYQDGVDDVVADRSQLQQVFMNIIVNAIQAMGERGILTVGVAMGEKEQVEIKIADTGGGIPREDIDKIFDPFYTTKVDGAGTGLGLSIAYGIITKHRGSIEVESEVGAGTVFTIRLPGTPHFAEDKRHASHPGHRSG